MAIKMSRRAAVKQSLRCPSPTSEELEEVKSSSQDAAELLLSLSSRNASMYSWEARSGDKTVQIKRRRVSKDLYSKVYTVISDDEGDEIGGNRQMESKVKLDPSDWRSICRPLGPPPRLPMGPAELNISL